VKRRYPWFPVLILAGILAVTYSLWSYASKTAESRDDVRFDTLAYRASLSLESRMQNQQLLVDAFAGHFADDHHVDQDNFDRFARAMRINESFPGLNSFGYLTVVWPQNVESEEKRFQKMGVQLRVDRNALAENGIAVPIAFTTPRRPTRAAIGFDTFRDPVRRAALERAWTTGEVSLTGKVTFPSTGEPGIVLYRAVYEGSETPATEEERRQRVRGFLSSGLRSEVVFKSIFAEVATPELRVEIYDGENPAVDELLYANDVEAEPGGRMRMETFQFAGRTWSIVCRESRAFGMVSTRQFVPLVPILGSIIAFLMSLLAWNQLRARERAEADAERLSREVVERTRAESEVRELNQNLERLVEERTRALRNTNEELEAFVYSASHDLRSPLRTVDGFSLALLEDYGDRLPEEGRDYLERMRRAAKRMDSLISGLLTLSRISRGELNREEVDVSQWATEAAAEAIRHYAPGLSVAVQIEPGIKAFADERLVHVLLDNLIGNAVKFSSKADSPAIEIGKRGEWYFVRDNGVGFAAEHAAKIFRPFERLHGPQEYPGTGIGLATVQRIVRRHGGEVVAVPNNGEGSGATFWFTLTPTFAPPPGTSPRPTQ